MESARERPIISDSTISKKPKTVRVVLPGEDEPKENNEVNVVMTATVVTSTSPSKKKRHSSISHLNLDEEVERAAKAKRKTSDAFNLASNLEDEDKSGLAQLVASLRRQNDELRQRFDGNGSSNEKDVKMWRMAEKECEELRTTVAKLDRLLSIEREERNVSEQKTLELLQNVKQKWHEKEENRLQKLRSDLKAANTVVQDMEMELMKKQSSLESVKEKLEAVTEVKSCLKSKLEKCKARLEATLVKYEDRCKALESLEAKYNELEKVNSAKMTESNAKSRRATLTLNENRAELEAIRLEVDRIKDRRSGLEAELNDARLTVKSLTKKVDVLTEEKSNLGKEYEEHLNKCESNIFKLSTTTAKLRAEKEQLEEKLESKDKKLKNLENVLEALEEKLPHLQNQPDNDKEREQAEIIENLQKEFSLQKVELRIAEKKVADQKDRISFLREMHREEKEKRTRIESNTNSEADKISQLETALEKNKLDVERLKEIEQSLKSRLQSANNELNEFRKDAEKAEDMEQKWEELEQSLASKVKELDRLEGVQRHYDLTKNVCYELEDQIKEYERIIQKLECSQEKLLESNSGLKAKAEASSADLIAARGQLNELESMAAFKDSRIKDLEEKNKESEVFYEGEGDKWKTRYDEVSDALRQQSSTAIELKDALVDITYDRDRCRNLNEHLSEQNSKLKEESASLITGIHSLKDSNMMLQGSVRELAEKLARRDQEIERQGGNIKTLSSELQLKEHEHKVTLEQLKKLTQHLPEGGRAIVTSSKHKKEKPFANLLL